MSAEVFMAFTKEQIGALYRKRARNYNFTANLYYLIGFRQWKYREDAVKALNLNPGDTVVEIGCGTGLNFQLLEQAVGHEGKVIGVDLTEEMLEQARRRVRKMGWGNVELVQCDASTYKFPKGVGGIISTFAITLIPEYDSIIKNGAEALLPNRSFAILDLKKPDNLPVWSIRLGVYLTKPFGVSLDLADRHPWESVEKYFAKYFFTESYLGFIYIAVGEMGKNC